MWQTKWDGGSNNIIILRDILHDSFKQNLKCSRNDKKIGKCAGTQAPACTPWSAPTPQVHIILPSLNSLIIRWISFDFALFYSLFNKPYQIWGPNRSFNRLSWFGVLYSRINFQVSSIGKFRPDVTTIYRRSHIIWRMSIQFSPYKTSRLLEDVGTYSRYNA